MITGGIPKKAWAILEPGERRVAVGVASILTLTGFLSALMVASIWPFLAVLADPAAIENTPVLKFAYELFGFESRKSFLFALGVTALVIIIAASLAQMARTYIISRFVARQSRLIGIRLLANYLHQPYLFFVDRHSGDLSNLVLSMSRQIVDQFYRPAAETFAAFFSVFAILALVLWYSPVVSLVSIAVLGGAYSLTFLLVRAKVSQIGMIQFSSGKQLYRICLEAIGGIKAIKILNREAEYIRRFEPPSREVGRTQALITMYSEIPNILLQALGFGGIVLIALVLIDWDGTDMQVVLSDLLPLIGLLAFAGQRLLPELQRIYAGLMQLQYGSVAVEAIYKDLILMTVDATRPAPEAPPIRLSRDVALEDVSFRYPAASTAGLGDISLRIGAGERVGIIGPTGSGKSTLADLLLGLIEPDEGAIIVDGTPLSRQDLPRWQASLGYVPQDIFLTDATIAENIALGQPPEEIDHHRVRQASRIAKLNEFIEAELPEGYGTHVGERGVRLSGGQQQRIGIARALYTDASLLIFDEATSALDTLTEKEVMASIDALPNEVTVVMIAHRLSTIRQCDQIFLLDKGSLVASGPWTQLLEESELFRTMVEDTPPQHGEPKSE